MLTCTNLAQLSTSKYENGEQFEVWVGITILSQLHKITKVRGQAETQTHDVQGKLL